MSVKEKIRQEMLGLRRSQRKKERLEKSRAIKRKLFSLEDFVEARTVSFYLSMESEVQTYQMVTEALTIGKKIVVPCINTAQGRLTLSEVKDPDKELVPGPYTILQPGEKYCRPVPLDQVDLMILPGLAFDHRGHRLGFGKGFYDKLLSQKREGTMCVGLAFQFQVLDEIPALSHDVPMEIIITEKIVIRTGSEGAKRGAQTTGGAS